MPDKFEIGHAVMWDDGDLYVHGVVIGVDNGMLEVVPVRPLFDDVICYDEGGSKYPADKDNVRLKLCPPPFSLLCAASERNGCYALAAKADRFMVSEADAGLYNMYVIEDDKVKQRDIDDILDHPWRDEKQSEVGWRSFRQAEPEPAPVRKPMSAAERLRAAMAIAPQDVETDGPDGPDF